MDRRLLHQKIGVELHEVEVGIPAVGYPMGAGRENAQLRVNTVVYQRPCELERVLYVHVFIHGGMDQQQLGLQLVGPCSR